MMVASEQSPQLPLVIGLDGGGTKTVAWLAAAVDGRVLGRGFGGPSNQRAVGPVSAMHGLETAVAAAFLDARLERQTVAAACLGLAGAGRESDRRVVEQWAEETRLADRVQVVNDALPLLYAEGMHGSGAALIAGTGSLALGRTTDGRTARCGGWGWLFGDEGSAFHIGRAILIAVTRSADGRLPRTLLTDLVLDHFRVSTPAEIVAAVYGHELPRSVIAELAPLAFTATSARTSDEVAVGLLNQAAEELGELVAGVVGKLSLPQPMSLALSGALLIRQENYRERVLTGLRQRGLETANVAVVVDAVSGAVEMARSLLSSPV